MKELYVLLSTLDNQQESGKVSKDVENTKTRKNIV
jgi:hypothetical protein